MQGMQHVTVGAFTPSIVLMSFVVSVFGSWCGLNATRRARRSQTRAQWAWLFAAAVSIGGGAIWSMHFIGMLAFDSKVRYSFDLPMTVGSLAAAIAAAMLGLTIATTVKGLAGYLSGGLITGLGVCVMHYMGMYAMNMPAEMVWRAPIVVLSVVIAVAAATLALYFALNLEKVWMMITAAVVMGIGVCVMHYTGMFALMIKPDKDAMLTFEGGVDPFALALPIFAITSVLLIAVAFAGLMGEETREDLDPIEPPANLGAEPDTAETAMAARLRAQMAFVPQQRTTAMPNSAGLRPVPMYDASQQAPRPQRFQAQQVRPQPIRPRPFQPQSGQRQFPTGQFATGQFRTAPGQPAQGQGAPGRAGQDRQGGAQQAGQHVAGRSVVPRTGTTSAGLPRRR